MADYYVDINGTVSRKKKKKPLYSVALDGTITRNYSTSGTGSVSQNSTSAGQKKKPLYSVALDGTVTRNYSRPVSQGSTFTGPAVGSASGNRSGGAVASVSGTSPLRENARLTAQENILKEYGTFEQFYQANLEKMGNQLMPGMEKSNETMNRAAYDKLIQDETDRLLKADHIDYREELETFKNSKKQEQRDWADLQEENLEILKNEQAYNAVKACSEWEYTKNHTDKRAGRYLTDKQMEYEAAKETLLDNGYDEDKIESLVDTYERARDAEDAAEFREETKEKASGSVIDKIGMNLGAVLASPFSGLGVMEAVKAGLNQLLTGEYTPVNTNSVWYQPGEYGDIVTQTTAEDIEASVDNPAAKTVLPLVYRAGMSAAESMTAAALGGGGAAGKMVSAGIMSAGAASSGTQEAFERTGDTGKALLTGAAAGLIEYGTEKISLDHLWDMAKNSGRAATRNTVVNILAQSGIEGSEEATSEVANLFVDNLINGGMSDYNLNVKNYMEQGMSEEEAKSQATRDFGSQVLESFAVGSIAGGMSGGVAAAVSPRRSRNSWKVVDAETESRIAAQEKDGKKLSGKEKAAIRRQVETDLEKGYISTDTIERTLGGETYEAYRTLTEEMEEYKNLNRMKQMEMTGEQQDRLAQLKEKNKNTPYESEIRRLKEQLSREVSDLARGDAQLGESYQEQDRRRQAFEADLSRYSGKQQEVIQKAADSGLLNNTRRTHEFVDLVAKISADKGISFEFANNQKIRESGFALEGKTVNGYVRDGNVTLNIQSNKALETVVGHEITHVLEGTEHYGALQEAVFAYARAKGDYDGRMRSLTKLYEGVEGADVSRELLADLVGDYLFTDADFVKRLSVEHRNVFQKIYDEIKYLWKAATAGSREARQLEKAKRLFEEAYREGMKNQNAEAQVRYSVSEGMTDSERYAELKDKEIAVPVAKENAALESYDLRGKSLYDVYKFLKDKKDVLGLNKTYRKDEIQLEFDYSNGGIKKSVRQSADNKVDIREYLDLLSCLDEVIESSVLIERHGDKAGVANSRLKQVYVLLGAYQKNEILTPVQLEIKENVGMNNQLYLAVAIKKSGVNIMAAAEAASITSPDFFKISIQDLVKNVNSGATDFLKYIPSEFLSKEQLEGKRKGMMKDIEKYPNSPFREELAEINKKLGVQQYSLSEIPLDKRLSGDALLDAEDLISEIEDMAEISPNGYVTLYHRTTQENADKIMESGKMSAKEDGLFFSTRKDGQYTDGFGDAVVEFKIPVEKLVLDDIFDNEAHLRIPLRNRNQVLDVSEYLQRNDIRYSLSDQNDAAAPRDRRRTYGRDIALEGIAPVQQGGQESRSVEHVKNGAAAPIRDDVTPPSQEPPREDLGPVRGDVSSKEAAPVEPGYTGPPRTVKEANRIKQENYRVELRRLPKERNQSHEMFNADIAKKQAEYDSLKNKNTKRARELQEQIDRLKTKRDNKDVEFVLRGEKLKERIAKMNTEEFRRAENRMTKQQEYGERMRELMGNTTSWRDKRLGISYQVNTLKRNLRDIVRTADGKRDIARADAIYEELQGSYNHNEALLNRESSRIKDKYRKMRITAAEDAYIQMLGEYKYNPDCTLQPDKLKEFYDKHKKSIDEKKVDRIIEDARALYDSLYERINRVLREQGMKEIPYRKGYFPHFTKEKQSWLAKLLNWKVNDGSIPTDIAGITETFTPERSWQSFNKRREGDTTDYSFQKGLDSYVNGALDWIYHIADIQKRRAFENEIRYQHSDKGVKERIEEIKKNPEWDADRVQQEIDAVYAEADNPLNNFVTDLRNSTNNLAGKKSAADRGLEQGTNRKIYSVMTNLSNRVSANMVGGSISSAFTNFIPITQSWGQVSPVSSLKAMRDTVKSYIRNDGMVERSDFLTNRLARAENLYQSGWDKAGKAVGIMMDVIDNFTSQTVWRSKYIENVKSGMETEKAVKNADQFAEGVMAGRSRGNMPTIYNAKNPLAKLFTAFQLEVGNQYGYMFKDLPQDVGDRSKFRLARGYAAMFLGAYAYNALYSSLTGRDAAFDPIGILEQFLRDLGLSGGGGDDEEKEGDPLKAAGGLAENILQEVPFVGGFLGGGRFPISSAIPYGDLVSTVSETADELPKVFSAWAEGEKAPESSVRELTSEWLKPLLYLGMPVGGGQLRKTLQGLSMFDDDLPVSGSYTNSGELRFPVEDTVGNRIQAGIFGQYSSQNARDYFDNGWAPLSEKQLEEYKELDIPIRDYREYREGLKGLDTLEEKTEYIAGLDLPISKKNIMINNLTDRKTPIDLTGYEDFGSFEEFDFSQKNPGKYEFLQANQISYQEYDASEESREAYNWAYEYPEKYMVAKAASGNVVSYRRLVRSLNKIQADRDEDGNAIAGSRKEKVIDFLNDTEAAYEEKILLFKEMYPNDDTYNQEIVDYLNGRDDISYGEMETILLELGFEVDPDGTIRW